jgi:protein ImuA
MSQGGTSARVGFLRERIAAIEGSGGARGSSPDPRPHLDVRASVNFGEGCSLDRVLDGGLARGALHEIVPGRPGDAAAASGFAAALATRFTLEHLPPNQTAIGLVGEVPRQRPGSIARLRKIDIDSATSDSAIWGRRNRVAPKGDEARSVVWILEDGTRREWGAPYGPGLHLHGLDPTRLVLVHARDTKDIFWSFEEAVKCRAVAAVVAEIWTLEKAYDLTASRRLVLAAQNSGTPALLVASRLARDAERLSSAAATRFEIFSLRGTSTVPPSHPGRGPPLPGLVSLPGLASWQVRIVKARAGPASMGFDRDRYLTVTWDHEKACFRDAFPLALSALPRNRSGPPADARARLVGSG